MRNLFTKFILLGSIASFTVSCNDSFLERTPTNDLNQASYWNTIADLESYTNGIYNEAASGTYKFMSAIPTGSSSSNYGPYPMDVMSDNYASLAPAHNWAAALAAGRETVPSGSSNYGGWSWGLLRRINVFMENYDKVDADVSAKAPYVGEALFFRAWFYFYMVQNYGDVPLITKALGTDSPELYAPRTPRAEVMEQVLQDINEACELLPTEWDSDHPNRITQGAALALKSRICLYEGTYRKYHTELGLDGSKFLQECVDACEAAMKLGYEIYNTGQPDKDYASLFITDDLEGNSEVILYRKYADPWIMHRMTGYIVDLRQGPTKDFVDDFLCIDSDGEARPVALSKEYSNDTPELEFTNRDPRLYQTALTPAVVDPETEAEDIDTPAKRLFQDFSYANFSFPRIGNMEKIPSATGYHPIKFFDHDQSKKGYNKETQDYPLFRYAEVLLNYAEAKAELGQCDQAVLNKTINVLRDRVDMPHLNTVNPEMDPKYAKYGISSLLVEIRRERRVELSLEYLRYQDLMRWAWGEKLKERVLGMRLEDEDFDNPRYKTALKNADGTIKKDENGNIMYDPNKIITKAGSPNEGPNPIYVYVAEDGKQYIDVYGGTNYAAEYRTFDPKKDYLRPIPGNAISANTALEQNPGWNN